MARAMVARGTSAPSRPDGPSDPCAERERTRDHLCAHAGRTSSRSTDRAEPLACGGPALATSDALELRGEPECEDEDFARDVVLVRPNTRLFPTATSSQPARRISST